MIKTKTIFVFALAFFIAFIGGILMAFIQNKSPDVNAFEVSEYEYYMKDYSSEENLGFISDTKDLLKKIEALWIEKYGERIKSEKPYHIFYDEKNRIWLVQGSLRSNTMGGIANILVENDTGKVLAVWHDK